MKSYKVKFVAPLAIAGVAALGFATSTPAPAADMAVYGAKKVYGTKKKKAVYGKKPYGADKKKMPYGSSK